MKTEVLVQLDGLIQSDSHVFLMAATNHPWVLDQALMRRLEKRILCPLPSAESRLSLIHKLLPPARSEAVVGAARVW